MRIPSIVFIQLIMPVVLLNGQSLTNSNLPIVIITTDGGVSITDEPKVPASMKIIYRGPGQRNYVSDKNNPSYLNYNGRIAIELRGSTSQTRPKKCYGFTTRQENNLTNNNVSLLGMPEENDWVLGGMVFDPALIRDYLCHNLSRRIGEYSSRTAYCEVIINNDYKGLYILQEKIKADDNRVDVIKIQPTDNSLPALSGGFITKADKTTGGDPVAWTMYSWIGYTISYIHHMPEPEDVTAQQNSYIKGEFLKLETAAKNYNSSKVNGYPSIIDIPSFIDFMIMNELASNADAYTYSTFFHKDRNGKLRAGPLWDLDLTYGNDLFMSGFDRSKTNVWQFQDGGNDGSKFWRDLFKNSDYRCYFSKRWNELTATGQPLHRDSIHAFVDQTAALIGEAVSRDYQRWSITGSFSERITALKSFISDRITWMTANIGSYAACNSISLPQLVITRIMYHPPAIPLLPDDEFEFLEITNNGSNTVDMTGVYFLGTGFVYQFPPGFRLGPGSPVVLASNANAFLVAYGFQPFGQFTQHLSNSSEHLVLADAFGNVIDNVHYSDSAPWPDTDGNGYYLKLIDTDLDNSLASSWLASDETITSVSELAAENSMIIYPNPASDVVTVYTRSPVMNIRIYDLQGRQRMAADNVPGKHAMDICRLAEGIYIVEVITPSGSCFNKMVKN